MLTRLITWFERCLFAAGGLLLLGSVGLAFYAVVLRYGFNDSKEWIEEGSRYLALGAALLVAGPVLRNRGHVVLDLVPSVLKGRRAQLHRIAVGLVGLAVGAGISLWGAQLVIRTFNFGMKTGSLQFPLWMPYAIIPVGMAIFVIFCLIEIAEAAANLWRGDDGREERTDSRA